MDAVVDVVQAADVDGELRGDVAGKALDLHRGHDLLQHPDFQLGDRGRLANRGHRDVDCELLAQVDGEQVDVLKARGTGVHLELAYQHLARAAAVEQQVHQVAVAGSVPHLLQAAPIDGQG